MTDREKELWNLACERGEHIAQLEAKVRFFENIIGFAVCKKCGGVSWDIPLSDYCQCDTPGLHLKAIDLLSHIGGLPEKPATKSVNPGEKIGQPDFGNPDDPDYYTGVSAG